MRKMRILLLSVSFLLATFCLYKPDYDQAKASYLKALTPPSCLSVKAEGKLGVLHDPLIRRFYRFDPAYTLLGLSYNFEHYKNNETLFIFDESQDDDTLMMGRRYKTDEEIVLPLNTALKLNKDVSSLLHSPIFIYYKHKRQVRGKRVMITGIAKKVAYDAFYAKENVHLKWQKELFKKQPQPRYGMIYVKGSVNQAKRRLEKKYPELTFQNTRAQPNTSSYRVLLIISLIFVVLMLGRLPHQLRLAFREHTLAYLISLVLVLFAYWSVIGRENRDAINQSFYFHLSSLKLLILYFGSLLVLFSIHIYQRLKMKESNAK